MMPLFSYVDPVSANLMWHASILKQVVHEFKFLSCAMLYFYIDNFSRIYCGTQIKFIRQICVMCCWSSKNISDNVSRNFMSVFATTTKKQAEIFKFPTFKICLVWRERAKRRQTQRKRKAENTVRDSSVVKFQR